MSALCQALSAATLLALSAAEQRPWEVGITLELQKLRLRRLRNLPRSTQLASGRAQTQTQGRQAPRPPGLHAATWRGKAPGVLRRGSRQGSALTGSVALAGWSLCCWQEPSRGIPAAETANGVIGTESRVGHKQETSGPGAGGVHGL